MQGGIRMFISLPYIILFIIFFSIAGVAKYKVRITFNMYKKVKNLKHIQGAQAARQILNSNNLTDVRIEQSSDNNDNHYLASGRVIKISEEVYNSETLGAIGIAVHQAGHAVQDYEGHSFLRTRAVLLPLANIASSLAWILFLIGIIFEMVNVGAVFLELGIALYIAGVLIHLLTLPVETGASKIAMELLSKENLLSINELESTKKVLDVAAYTYIAGAFFSIMSQIKSVMKDKQE